MDENTKKLAKLLKRARIEEGGFSALYDEVEPIFDLADELQSTKGVLKGYSPIVGKDYFTDLDKQQILDAATPRKGEHYVDGVDGLPGKDGVTPVRGIDYFTPEDIRTVTIEATPIKGRDYFTTEEIAQLQKDITPIKGRDYSDGINPSVTDIVGAFKTLKGKDAEDFSRTVGGLVDISHVRNASQFIFNGKEYDISELMHGGGSGGGGGTPGGVQYDVQLNDGAGGFSGSNNLNFQGGYLTINGDSGYGQLQWLNSPLTGGYGGSGINGTNDEIIVGALAGDLSIWASQAISLSADAGATKMISINTDGSFTIGAYTLPATDGSMNQVLQTDGLGTVTWQTVSGGGGTPGGLNAQLQYNNAGSFGGISGATTDGSAVSLNAAHLLNPTINGAGVGLATLVYPNTASNATITFPATTGTVALTSDLTGYVTAVTGTSARITSSGGTTPSIDIASTYVGQTSITTLGTIATGTWSATTIALNKGGTGQTTKAAAFDALSPMSASGDIIYGGTAGTGTRLAKGSDTQVLTLAGGVPTWASPTTGTVTSVSGTTNRITSTGGATPVIDISASYVGQSSITTLGTITTGTWTGTTIAVANGGTGQTTYTNGQILIGNTTGNTLTKATLTQGTGVVITNGTGTITIAATAAGLTVGTSPIASGTTTRVLFDNAGTLGEYVISGSGNVAMTTSPAFTTPSLGVATATSINGNTFTTGTYTLTGTAGKTLNFTNTLTLSGTDSTTMTFPTTSKTIAANDGSNWTIASQAIGDLLTATSTTAYGRLAAVATGSVLASSGTGTAPTWTTGPQVTTIELGAATDTTISRVSAGVIAVEGVTVLTTSNTQTVTNKRNQPRTASTTTASTLAPDLSSANVYYRTTQTASLSVSAPIGTPVIGEVIAIYVDAAGAQTLTMDATYIAFGAAFPASLTAGKTFMAIAQYNGTNWKTTWANAQ